MVEHFKVLVQGDVKNLDPARPRDYPLRRTEQYGSMFNPGRNFPVGLEPPTR